MFRYIFTSLHNYERKNLKDDIVAGIIVTSLSVPVSMGYAQVAGLPPIYGLYASFLPLIIYAAFSSTNQLIFGIGAASSAITASVLALVNVPLGGSDALLYVPALSLLTGIILLLFSIFKVGKLIGYIPVSVMSGFIFGIGLSIMFSQTPKILGIMNVRSGFLGELRTVIFQFSEINVLSAVIGIISIVVIIGGKKLAPKVPFSLFVLIGATIASAVFNFSYYGIKIVGKIEQGLPSLHLDNPLRLEHFALLLLGAFATAIVVSVDSLLTGISFSSDRSKPLKENREMFAFSMSNLASAISGSAPTSASMSRTAANVQFHGKTQLTSLISAGIILLVLVFFSNLLYYMPQSILSAIVFSALFSILKSETKELKVLIKKSPIEAYVWLIAMLGVFLIGVIVGITLGIILTIAVMIVMKVILTPSTFLGHKENTREWYDIRRNKDVKEIENVIVYRFSGSLYFLNIKTFINEINSRITVDTKAVIVDAHAMTTLDITAAHELSKFLYSLDDRKVYYYFVNTIGDFRDIIKERDLQGQLSKQHLFKTIDRALRDLESKQESSE